MPVSKATLPGGLVAPGTQSVTTRLKAGTNTIYGRITGQHADLSVDVAGLEGKPLCGRTARLQQSYMSPRETAQQTFLLLSKDPGLSTDT